MLVRPRAPAVLLDEDEGVTDFQVPDSLTVIVAGSFFFLRLYLLI